MAHFIYTDFRYRYISLYTLVSFVVISGFMLWHYGNNPMMVERLINLLLVIMVFGLAFLVMKWRTGQSPKTVIGEGDILLMIPICGWFDLEPFLYWFNGTLILTLSSHFILQQFRPGTRASIPLAGYLAISFGVVQYWMMGIR